MNINDRDLVTGEECIDFLDLLYDKPSEIELKERPDVPPSFVIDLLDNHHEIPHGSTIRQSLPDFNMEQCEFYHMGEIIDPDTTLDPGIDIEMRKRSVITIIKSHYEAGKCILINIPDKEDKRKFIGFMENVLNDMNFTTVICNYYFTNEPYDDVPDMLRCRHCGHRCLIVDKSSGSWHDNIMVDLECDCLKPIKYLSDSDSGDGYGNEYNHDNRLYVYDDDWYKMYTYPKNAVLICKELTKRKIKKNGKWYGVDIDCDQATFERIWNESKKRILDDGFGNVPEKKFIKRLKKRS